MRSIGGVLCVRGFKILVLGDLTSNVEEYLINCTDLVKVKA